MPTSYGDKVTTITINNNDKDTLDKTFSFNLVGKGVGSPNLNIRNDSNIVINNSGLAKDFGEVMINSTSSTVSFLIENKGTDILDIGNISISNTEDFTITQELDSSITPSENNTTFNVSFNPKTGGQRTAIITIPSNDPDTPEYKISVKGIAKSEWTILVYLNGDNDLEGNGIEDINEMESVMGLAAAGISLIVLVDRNAGYDTSNGNWDNTRLYKIKHDVNGLNNSIISDRLDSVELGLTKDGNEELDMGDYNNLGKFADFGKGSYPANNYAYIIWNHGTGWRSTIKNKKKEYSALDKKLNVKLTSLKKREGSQNNGYKAVSFDESNGNIIYTNQIRLGLSGKGMDIIGFDTCYSNMIEVAYEIKDIASYMIGSEDKSPGDGWEYNILLNTFKSSSKTSIDFINSVVNAYATRYSSYAGVTIAGIDLSKINNLYSALNTFSKALYDSINTSAIRDEIGAILFNDSEDYYEVPGDNNIDIWDMANEILIKTDYADAESVALKSAVEDAVVLEWHNSSGNPDSHGIAIHLISLNSDGVPIGHNNGYVRNVAGVENPLLFVEDNSNYWVLNENIENSLLYRIWYEEF